MTGAQPPSGPRRISLLNAVREEAAVTEHMRREMVRLMTENDAPAEQFERMGLVGDMEAWYTENR